MSGRVGPVRAGRVRAERGTVAGLPGAGGRAGRVCVLQRWAGNAALARLVSGPGVGGDAGSVVRRVLCGSGRPLPQEVRRDMEGRMGADFSRVRVHTGAEAHAAAGAVQAHAFTSGEHVAFANGRFAPATGSGRRLLAHELAHTVQQASGEVAGAPGPQGLRVSDPQDHFERAADRLAQQALSGGTRPAAAQAAVPQAAGPATSAADGCPVSGGPSVQRVASQAPLSESAPPRYRQVRPSGAGERPANLRALDRAARVAHGGAYGGKGVASPHVASAVSAEGRLALAGNTGKRKVTKKQQEEADQRLAAVRQGGTAQGAAADSNPGERRRAKDVRKLRALESGDYATRHGNTEQLTQIAGALRQEPQWSNVAVGGKRPEAEHGEMTLLGQQIATWPTTGRPAGAAPKVVQVGGVKKACAGCQWVYDGVNATIGRERGYRVEASGTHGQPYPGWRMPDWVAAEPALRDAVIARAEAEGWSFALQDVPGSGGGTARAYVLVKEDFRPGEGVEHDPAESESDWEEAD
nr:DUF4157 domain-containing protein [Streptomyces yunnanensis]